MIDWDKVEKLKSDEELLAESEFTEARQYLQSTDWQVIANIERGREIPADVRAKRDQALDVVTKA